MQASGGNLKFERLCELLRERMKPMRQGEPLPSLRALMKEYAVSQLTVDKAKAQLVREGLLCQPAGRAAYVRGGASKPGSGRALRRLLFATPAWESPFFNLIASELRSALGDGASLDCFKYSSLSEMRGLASSKPYDGLALVPGPSESSLSDLCAIVEGGAPCVFLDRAFDDLAVDSAQLDSAGAGALAARHLLELGHRRIALMLSEPHVSSIMARAEAFKACVEMAGASLLVLDCGTRPGDSGIANAHRKMSEALSKRGFDATAIFVDSDPSAPGVMKVALDKGLRIPGDLSVVSCSGTPESAFCFPSLTSVSFDYAGLASWTVEALKARLSGSVPKDASQKFKAPPVLLRRDSSGPLKGRNSKRRT